MKILALNPLPDFENPNRPWQLYSEKPGLLSVQKNSHRHGENAKYMPKHVDLCRLRLNMSMKSISKAGNFGYHRYR